MVPDTQRRVVRGERGGHPVRLRTCTLLVVTGQVGDESAEFIVGEPFAIVAAVPFEDGPHFGTRNIEAEVFESAPQLVLVNVTRAVGIVLVEGGLDLRIPIT